MVVLDEARSQMAALRREIAGELRAAAFASIASVVFLDTVKTLQRAYPRLKLQLGSGTDCSWPTYSAECAGRSPICSSG